MDCARGKVDVTKNNDRKVVVTLSKEDKVESKPRNGVHRRTRARK